MGKPECADREDAGRESGVCTICARGPRIHRITLAIMIADADGQHRLLRHPAVETPEEELVEPKPMTASDAAATMMASQNGSRVSMICRPTSRPACRVRRGSG